MIKIIDSTWENFINETENLPVKKYIYRGQTNSYENYKFSQWDIISSFNRQNNPSQFCFKRFLSQLVEPGLFDFYFKNYEFVKNNNLDKYDLLSRLYFFQHYSIPTCLIDFTFDPLVALYFSFSSLKGHNMMMQMDEKGFSKLYPKDFKVSIYQINRKLLQDTLKIKDLDKNANRDLIINYNHYEIDLEKQIEWAHLAFDLNPISKNINIIDNFNLKKQKSCFLLFDNQYASDYDLISFIKKYSEINKIIFDAPLIKVYNIEYNNFFKPMRSRQPNYQTAFNYLEHKERTGKFLFNDIQGIKYDLNLINEK